MVCLSANFHQVWTMESAKIINIAHFLCVNTCPHYDVIMVVQTKFEMISFLDIESRRVNYDVLQVLSILAILLKNGEHNCFVIYKGNPCKFGFLPKMKSQ